MLKRKNSQRSNYLKFVLTTFAIGLILAVCIPVIMFFNLTVRIEKQQRENCIQIMSSPISLSAENYICENSELLSLVNGVTCDDAINDLTRSDLVHMYKDSIEIGSDTYADVNDTFGSFERYCPDIDARQTQETYRCNYNFVDMPMPVVFAFYNEENIVTEIQSASCPTTDNP